ncbi:MAG TPA: cupin domain-containing protein [Frankiaceae bacterium]|nr:cupin domain-containing protein [Frankiaceae bacterium]
MTESITVRPQTPSPHVLGTAVVESLSWQPLARLGAAQVKTLMQTSDSVAGLLRLDPGTTENAHVHADAHHHGWVLRGSATVGGAEISTGSYFHIPAGVRHAISDVGPDGCELFFVYQFTR